jgi:drug/metabolite transporter (DMT)-like permease
LAWLSLGYQTVIVTFASYLVWFWLVMRYQAAAVSGFTFLAPLFGIAAGAVFLGETATPALLIGLAAVAVGMRFIR